MSDTNPYNLGERTMNSNSSWGYPNNHKHIFFQKDHEKVMCRDCEFELDGEYYVQYVVPLEHERDDLQKKWEAALNAEGRLRDEVEELKRRLEKSEVKLLMTQGSYDYSLKENEELKLCLKNANALIAAQADESQRIVERLKKKLEQ